MTTPIRLLLGLATLGATLLTSSTATAADWPRWRGPASDDIQRETGLLKQWPASGPKQLWLYKDAGMGYSGFAIAGGKLFTMGTRDAKEVLLAIDANSGKELWVTPLSDVLSNKWGDGPRGTPTLDADLLFTLTGPGSLVCADAKSGKILWQSAMKDIGGRTPGWGYTESVLVDGNQVVCTPGGKQGAVAAFDKSTGKLLWQSKDWTDDAQYSSIVKASINGQPQYVQRTMQNVAGISPKDGSVLWKQAFPGKTAVIPTPIVDGNQVYVTAGYGVGSMSFRILPGNKVESVFDETSITNKVMKNHHGGVILVDGHIYGHSDGTGWTCQSFKTGELVWGEKQALGKGAIAAADGMFYCLDEGKGTVVLAEISSKSWSEKGRFTLDPQTQIRSPQGRIWTHPVISNGKLYLRDQDLVYCYDIKQ